MSRKRHKPEEIGFKLRQVDVLVSQGQSVADAVRSIGVTEVRPLTARSARSGSRPCRPFPVLDPIPEGGRLLRCGSTI